MTREAELTETILTLSKPLWLALGDLRPGALSEQYNSCRASTAVDAKSTHLNDNGSYHQLSNSHQGRIPRREHPP